MKPFDHQSGQLIQINHAQLYVERTGSEDGYPVLYLPGGFGHIAEFNGVLPYLPESIHLIGIDSRGHGRSTMGSRDLSYAQLESDVVAVVEQLNLKRLSIIGYSDGGIVAMRLAANQRLPIDKVIAIGAHWQLQADDPVREDFKQITSASWRDEFPGCYDEYMALNPEPDFDRFAKQVLNLWLDDDPTTGYPGEWVQQIQCELLIVHGEHDPYLTRDSMRALAERVPRSTLLTVADAGHAVHDDQRALFVEQLLAFLDEKI